VDFRKHQIGHDGCKQASDDRDCAMTKKTSVRSSSASYADTVLAPSHEEIATRAEALWRERGCPLGCDDELWLEAERHVYQRSNGPLEGENQVASSYTPSRLNLESDDAMGNVLEELDYLFPGPTGKETTSL
jgi:hypothetical protein